MKKYTEKLKNLPNKSGVYLRDLGRKQLYKGMERLFEGAQTPGNPYAF